MKASATTSRISVQREAASAAAAASAAVPRAASMAHRSAAGCLALRWAPPPPHPNVPPLPPTPPPPTRPNVAPHSTSSEDHHQIVLSSWKLALCGLSPANVLKADPGGGGFEHDAYYTNISPFVQSPGDATDNAVSPTSPSPSTPHHTGSVCECTMLTATPSSNGKSVWVRTAALR